MCDVSELQVRTSLKQNSLGQGLGGISPDVQCRALLLVSAYYILFSGCHGVSPDVQCRALLLVSAYILFSKYHGVRRLCELS